MRGERQRRVDPNCNVDEYFYDSNNEMLVDQGWVSVNGGNAVDDDYVWLGGRPLVIVRGTMSSWTTRLSDGSGSCGRNGDVGVCGAYFPVTDHIGKPVLMLDSTQRITGTGEYDPFGQVNRVSMDAETAHPYTAQQLEFADFVEPNVGNTVAELRVKFQAADLTGCDSRCTTNQKLNSDRVVLVDKGSSALLEWVTGKHDGTNWSIWMTPTNDTLGIKASLLLGTNPEICTDPNNCPATCTANARTGVIGAVLEGYEYRRYDKADGATPFWTPLRFPGQYHDEETDLNQNWNRFYDPNYGGYLETDPMLARGPGYTILVTRNGSIAPPFEYANGSPISYFDADGNMVEIDSSCDKYRSRIMNILQHIETSIDLGYGGAVGQKVKLTLNNPHETHTIKCQDQGPPDCIATDNCPTDSCAWTAGDTTTIYARALTGSPDQCQCLGRRLVHEFGHVWNLGANSESLPSKFGACSSCDGFLGLYGGKRENRAGGGADTCSCGL